MNDCFWWMVLYMPLFLIQIIFLNVTAAAAKHSEENKMHANASFFFCLNYEPLAFG